MLIHKHMKFTIKLSSTGKRLSVVCEDESHKTIFVRGHFKVINGKKTYVKAHYRKR